MNTRLVAISLFALAAHTPISARSRADVTPVRTSSAPERDLPTRVVNVGDLNLSHPAGAAELRRRLDRVVVELSGGRDVRHRSDVKAARAKARAQADALIEAAQS